MAIIIQTSLNGGTVITAKEILKQNKPICVIKFKSAEIMNSEYVMGNTYLESLGGKYITMGDLENKKFRL